VAKGYRPVDRDQRFLMPPDMREWLSAEPAGVALLVSETDPAVQLRVAGRPAFQAGHADQDQPEVQAVEVVTQLLEPGGAQPVGLVHHEQRGVRAGWVVGGGRGAGVGGPSAGTGSGTGWASASACQRSQ